MFPSAMKPGDETAFRKGDVFTHTDGHKYRVDGASLKFEGGDLGVWYISVSCWNGTAWEAAGELKDFSIYQPKA